MKQSLLALKTNKEAPSDADSVNARLLTQSGFVKKEMAGVYSYLPLGLRVLRKIEKIVIEEMESVGSQQVLMPALTPRKNWETTGRYGVDIAYTPSENTVLGWSHEEMVTPIAKEILRSYKNFPLSLFQIQTKFRNEPRAKSGLLRGREFIMKDAYSFHPTQEDLEEYYEKMAAAYFRVYERCGLKSYRIKSGGGDFTDAISDEFSVITPAGEDTMVFCSSCSFAQNIEVATALPPVFSQKEEVGELEKFENDRPKDIAKTASELGIPEAQILKTVVFVQENGEMLGVCIRGDLQVSSEKAERYIGGPLRSASPKELLKKGLVIGFISPVQSTTIPFVCDESVTKIVNFYTGANEEKKDYKNVNFERDFSGEVGDFSLATKGFSCPECQKELDEAPCVEVGNIFDLGSKYSEAFSLKFTDKDGKEKPVLMGCYGIGVSRLMGTVVESSHDEKGIIWHKNIAPFQVHILSLREDEEAQKLAFELEEDGYEVLFDDRNESPGKKFADADLIGIPLRIVVSKRTLEKESVELSFRATGEKEEVPLSGVARKVWDFYEGE